jgi:hypothetical protein
MTENGLIMNLHTFELVEDNEITRCDRCALLDKCTEFWAMVEDENPKLCTFLYGDEADGKRFQEAKI